MDRYILTNSSILHQVTRGPGPTVLFLPGGPGLKSEYFLDLIKYLPQSLNCWLFDYGTNISSTSNVFKTWSEDLSESLTILKKPIVVGHSFGGWIAMLNQDALNKTMGLILMNTCPSYSAFQSALSSYQFNIPDEEKAFNDYSNNPSNETFKKLFISWLPYYFSDNKIKNMEPAFSQYQYDHKAYDLSSPYMQTYKTIWEDLAVRTLVISGDTDRICPIEVMSEHPLFKNNSKVSPYIVKNSGHFPWLENLHDTKTILVSFIDFL